MQQKIIIGIVCIMILVVGAILLVRERRISPQIPCNVYLRQIQEAKNEWALQNNKNTNDIPDWSDLVGSAKYFNEKPVCPSGGKYTIGNIAAFPSCSIPNHELK